MDWTESLIFGHFSSQRKNGRNVSTAWPCGAGTGTLVSGGRCAELLDVCPGGADVLPLAVARCPRLPVLRGDDSSFQALFSGV